jgi:hypothetical protein
MYVIQGKGRKKAAALTDSDEDEDEKVMTRMLAFVLG